MVSSCYYLSIQHGDASRSLSPPKSRASASSFSSTSSTSDSYRSSGSKSPPPKPQFRPPKPNTAPPPPGLPAHRAKSPAGLSKSMEFARPLRDKLPAKQTQSHDLLSPPSSHSPHSHSLSPGPMEVGHSCYICTVKTGVLNKHPGELHSQSLKISLEDFVTVQLCLFNTPNS